MGRTVGLCNLYRWLSFLIAIASTFIGCKNIAKYTVLNLLVLNLWWSLAFYTRKITKNLQLSSVLCLFMFALTFVIYFIAVVSYCCKVLIHELILFVVQLGIGIRAATSGHIPSTAFMLVSMGSTGILLIGWRALISNFLPNKQTKKSDVYKRGSAFELFEVIKIRCYCYTKSLKQKLKI